jgi:hypothetical protein
MKTINANELFQLFNNDFRNAKNLFITPVDYCNNYDLEVFRFDGIFHYNGNRPIIDFSLFTITKDGNVEEHYANKASKYYISDNKNELVEFNRKRKEEYYTKLTNSNMKFLKGYLPTCCEKNVSEKVEKINNLLSELDTIVNKIILFTEEK